LPSLARHLLEYLIKNQKLAKESLFKPTRKKEEPYTKEGLLVGKDV
jgi:hypothetical protein